MKKLSFIFLLAASLQLARADNWLQNGDFSDGLNNWAGNGRSPADMAPDNPLDKPDPLLTKGLILPLRPGDWDKVTQDFKGQGSEGILTISYIVAPDTTFSTKPEDYVNVPDLIHYDGWRAFNIPQGNWLVFVADFGEGGGAHGTYYMIQPKFGTGEVQTIRDQVKGLTPHSDKTITIAFPPGTGNVILLSVGLTDQ